MNTNTLSNVLATGLGVAMMFPAVASADQDRVSATEKGSLLVFPTVEVIYGADYAHKDTVIQLTNDDNNPVDVQMYFVNGDGCCFTDVRISLTANQPVYWKASTGLPAAGGISPWSILDNECAFGAPADIRSDTKVYGFIVAWAVDAENKAIRHDHLAGNATIFNFDRDYAWGYNAYAFQGLDTFDGSDGDLVIGEGADYAPGFAMLLMNFFAHGSTALSVDGYVTAETLTKLTLLPIDWDFRQETAGPPYTKAHMDVWNMNEVKLSGAYACVDCWRQDYTDDLDGADHFNVENLQTDVGKVRIEGLASQLCPPFTDAWGHTITSAPHSLLGVAKTAIKVDGSNFGAVGHELFGMGTEGGSLMYDPGTGPVPTGPGNYGSYSNFPSKNVWQQQRPRQQNTRTTRSLR